eukprot:1530312-Amphidinium_carterae.2
MMCSSWFIGLALVHSGVGMSFSSLKEVCGGPTAGWLYCTMPLCANTGSNETSGASVSSTSMAVVVHAKQFCTIPVTTNDPKKHTEPTSPVGHLLQRNAQ